MENINPPSEEEDRGVERRGEKRKILIRKSGQKKSLWWLYLQLSLY